MTKVCRGPAWPLPAAHAFIRLVRAQVPVREKGDAMRSENEMTHYSARITLTPQAGSPQAIEAVAQTMFSWVCGKEHRRSRGQSNLVLQALEGHGGFGEFLDGKVSVPSNYEGGLRRGRTDCVCTRMSRAADGAIDAWAFEYDEWDHDKNERHWHTCMGVVPAPDGSAIVNARVSYYTTPDYMGAPLPAPNSATPNFMKNILQLAGYAAYVGGDRILAEPLRLNAETLRGTFARGLQNGGRELTYVLISSDENGVYPISGLRALSQQTLGMANTYLLDWSDEHLRSELFGLFPKGTAAYRYNCPRSTIRVYRSGVNLANPFDASRHRYFTKDQVTRDGEGAVLDIICRGLCQGSPRNDGDVVDLHDIAWRESRRAAHDLSAKLAEMRRRAKEVQPSGDDSSDVAELRRRLKKAQDDFQACEPLLDEAQESIDALEAELAQAKADSAEIGHLRYQNDRLQAENEVQRENVESLRAVRETMERIPHLPTSLSEMLDYAESLWPERLVVLPEAKKSAREFRGKDRALDEQWQILRAAATTLWELYFGPDGGGDIPGRFKAVTTYDLTLVESGQTRANPRLMKLRERTYDGKTISVEPHIKGKDRVASYKLRVHYYADNENRKIVIGHCGEHMETAGTPYVR